MRSNRAPIEAQPEAHIRIAASDEAFAIAAILARSFAEYESSYTPEAFAATISTPDRILDLDEWLGEEVSLDFHFFETEEMKAYLGAAGFELEEVIERDPYPDIEVQTRRAYVFARKP